MIKVLIVDDSAVVRRILSERLGRASDVEVVGTAADPYLARDKIVELEPDVLTLDVEMPRMDGLTFLEKLMKYHPMPVIVVSSITPKGSHVALKALELGAVDVVSKPGSAYSVADISRQLVTKIRAAANARVVGKKLSGHREPDSLREPPALLHTANKVLAIGASTGGPEAIRRVLGGLPPTIPGTVIVQHMPEHFTSAFARRLDGECEMEVREAEGGEILRPGLALIAPGNKHLLVYRNAGYRNGVQYVAQVRDGPQVFHQRPSVEVLFNSVAKHVGANAVGVLLTGMGADGARGLLAMKEAMAKTIAQDEASCVVFGMPKVAIELGAADRVLPLDEIPKGIIAAFQAPREWRSHLKRTGSG